MRLMLAVVILCLASSCHAAKPGLRVENGVLVRDGKPFRGIGVNYFDCFARILRDPNDTSYREGFQVLAENHIPFARFMAGGYWPVDNKLYFENKPEFFRRMDGVVKAAEEYGIGLIPSFAWCYSTIPDLVGEPMVEWGNPKSKTIAFLRRYTREWVTRYKNSPAIWAWEFGNEFQLSSDLHMPEHRPPVWPTLGTAKSRSELDELTSKETRYANKAFVEEVRKYDKDRITISGNSFPRPAAWHRYHERTWKQDSVEQFREVLLADNEPNDVICGHLYGDSLPRFDRTLTYAEVLRPTLDIAARAGKPLFVEEFGTDESKGSHEAKHTFLRTLSAIEKTRVPIAALWVYDFQGQKDTYNVSATSRTYQLDAISAANLRMRESVIH